MPLYLQIEGLLHIVANKASALLDNSRPAR
ncbi:hypothetical protein SAMN05518845_105359 [Variovorax sp. YR750]|nr:hypothetical protein SAMN05518845_105359 [Variovorax sp. YR750]